MRRLLIALLTLANVSCASSTPENLRVPYTAQLDVAKDGHRFLQKEYENLTPGVEFILMKDEDQQKEVLRDVFGRQWKKIAGFTYWNEEKGTCRIYVKDPAWIYEPEYIGHEVAHCIWGRFHKGEEGKGPLW